MIWFLLGRFKDKNLTSKGLRLRGHAESTVVNQITTENRSLASIVHPPMLISVLKITPVFPRAAKNLARSLSEYSRLCAVYPFLSNPTYFIILLIFTKQSLPNKIHVLYLKIIHKSYLRALVNSVTCCWSSSYLFYQFSGEISKATLSMIHFLFCSNRCEFVLQLMHRGNLLASLNEFILEFSFGILEKIQFICSKYSYILKTSTGSIGMSRK